MASSERFHKYCELPVGFTIVVNAWFSGLDWTQLFGPGVQLTSVIDMLCFDRKF